jgi:hypothetical protein
MITDSGGPSRMFYEAVWRQLSSIAIEPKIFKPQKKLKTLYDSSGESDNAIVTVIKLFDESSPVGSTPTKDETLLTQIARSLKIELPPYSEIADLRSAVEHDKEGRRTLDEAMLFYRGVGHIMANCLVTNNVIAPNVLPQLFRNG